MMYLSDCISSIFFHFWLFRSRALVSGFFYSKKSEDFVSKVCYFQYCNLYLLHQLKNLNNKKMITINLLKITPFIGSDNSWKAEHGSDWKVRRKEYLDKSHERRMRLISKYGSKIKLPI